MSIRRLLCTVAFVLDSIERERFTCLQWMPPLSELIVKLGQLKVSIEVTGEGVGSSSSAPTPDEVPPQEAQPEPAAASASSASSSGTRRTPLGVATGPQGRKAYYVVFACPEDADLIGIHHGSWHQLKEIVPGGSVVGSSARDFKKFVDLEEAKAYFGRRAKSGTPCTLIDHGN